MQYWRRLEYIEIRVIIIIVTKEMSSFRSPIDLTRFRTWKHIILIILYPSLPYINCSILAEGNRSKTYLDKIPYLNSKNGLSERCQTATKEATSDLCSPNTMYLMYTMYDKFKLNLGVFCISFTQINFQKSLQCTWLNIFKHTITQQEMPRLTVLMKHTKTFSDYTIRNCGSTFWIPLDKHVTKI